MSSLPEAVQVGAWRVDPELDRIARDGQAIKIEPRAMRLLLYLIAHAGHVVTVDELLEHVWPDVVVGPDSVYQAVALLRRTLGDDRQHPSYITHIPRKGYRLIAPVLTVSAQALGADVNGPGGQIAPASSAVEHDPAPAVSAPALHQPADASGPPLAEAAARAVRRRDAGVWAVLALAILGLGGAYLLMRPAPPAAIRLARVEDPSAGSRVTPPAPSIAVLPFLDMSEKQDLGYLADGLTEELIDLLSRRSDLRVPARTSSFYFKGKAATVADIAHALNVDNLLEGSVRRSGHLVRITTQLIRADNGYHLWSQTYERDFTDIFGVEDDVAQAVSWTLEAKLNEGRPGAAHSTLSGEARNLLLQCQFFVGRNTGTDAEKAIRCYRELLAEAPQDASAWSGYANALWRLHRLVLESDAQDRASIADARAAAEHAIALDPSAASAHATLATIHLNVERDWRAADAELKAALAADPNDPASLLAAGHLARCLGEFERSIGFLDRARARDPLNFLPYARLAFVYLYLGKLPEAEAAARRRLDLSPEGLGGYTQLADVLLARRQYQEALETARREPNEESRVLSLALVYYALGRNAEAEAALAQLKQKFSGDKIAVAEIYAYRGDFDHAFAALEEAFLSADPELLAIKSDNYLQPLQPDPRYRALLRKLNLPEPGQL